MNAHSHPICKVASIAREYGELTAIRHAADCAGNTTEMDRLDVLRADLEMRASLLVPTSPTGAVFLLAIISSCAGVLEGCELREPYEARMHELIRRCTYRVAEYHRNMGGQLASIVWEYHMPDYLDPANASMPVTPADTPASLGTH